MTRGLALEAGFSSVEGTRTHDRTARLVQAGLTLAERVEEPSAIALAHTAAGVAAYLEGEGPRALEIWERAETLLRDTRTGVTWELDTLLLYKFRLYVVLGRLQSLIEHLPASAACGVKSTPGHCPGPAWRAPAWSPSTATGRPPSIIW